MSVVGIIIEQENKGKTISIEVVKKAVIDLLNNGIDYAMNKYN